PPPDLHSFPTRRSSDLAAALACQGVRCVFGVPGAQNNELWDALKARQVPYLLVTTECSASVMADAAARVTGEVGVFAVVPGPGLDRKSTRLNSSHVKIS